MGSVHGFVWLLVGVVVDGLMKVWMGLCYGLVLLGLVGIWWT
ncbi:hypothetical protein [Candidatus Hodgkinia cicadicola]